MFASCIVLLCFALAPAPAFAQKRWDPHRTHPPLVLPCSDSLCLTLENVFDAALIDFRQYRPGISKDTPIPPLPDVSVDVAKLNCRMSLWANNVPMYICAAQQPLAGADTWFRDVLQTAKELRPRWQATTEARGSDLLAEIGPPGCSPTAEDGPYLGQCPLHVKMTKLSDGNAKLELWVNSLTSSYLVPYEPLPTSPHALSARNSSSSPQSQR